MFLTEVKNLRDVGMINKEFKIWNAMVHTLLIALQVKYQLSYLASFKCSNIRLRIYVTTTDYRYKIQQSFSVAITFFMISSFIPMSVFPSSSVFKFIKYFVSSVFTCFYPIASFYKQNFNLSIILKLFTKELLAKKNNFGVRTTEF